MDRLDSMRVYLAVVDQGGFAAAARSLGYSAPAVTRAVASLEERVGTALLRRTTRKVRVTDVGARFAADCRRILAEVAEAEASAAGARTDPRGRLNITAPVLFGRRYIAPIVSDFLGQFPAVSARCLYVDRVVEMLDEGYDVALRIARLPDSSLFAVRVGSVRRVVCAAPSFLARHGTPQRPQDLAGLPAVSFSPGLSDREWVFGYGRQAVRVRPEMQLSVNVGDVAIAAAVAGQGVTQVLSYQVADELKAGRLVTLLEDHEPEPIPVHVVHSDGRQASARLRAFVDFAVARLRSDPAVNPAARTVGPAADFGH